MLSINTQNIPPEKTLSLRTLSQSIYPLNPKEKQQSRELKATYRYLNIVLGASFIKIFKVIHEKIKNNGTVFK